MTFKRNLFFSLNFLSFSVFFSQGVLDIWLVLIQLFNFFLSFFNFYIRALLVYRVIRRVLRASTFNLTATDLTSRCGVIWDFIYQSQERNICYRYCGL